MLESIEITQDLNKIRLILRKFVV